MSLDDAAWAEIARLWQAGDEPVAVIAERFGISRQKLTAAARVRKWPARHGGSHGRASDLMQPRPKRDRTGPGGRKTAGQAGGGRIAVAAGDRAGEAVAGANSAKPPGGRRRSRPSRRAMLERLFDAVDAKLIRLERHMQGEGDATAADGERTARSLNSLIRSFEKLTAFEDKLARGGGKRDGRNGDGGDGDKTEHRRQELARRIAKLREQR